MHYILSTRTYYTYVVLSAAASNAPTALSTAPSRAAYARARPSAPNGIPPLAIYVRRYALFLF